MLRVVLALQHTVMRTIYRPLPASHFRLLRICGTENDGAIECTLEQHDLLDPPGYSAVSYTWGEAENAVLQTPKTETHNEAVTHEIHVNGQPFRVTKNLYALLCEFRRTYPRNINYWIDAICINQDDLEEKTRQVNAMDQNFSRAVSVVVWLGKETLHTAKTIELINHLALIWKEEYELHGHCRKYAALNDPEDQAQMQMLSLTDVTRTDWLALIAFFQRRWFFRVWTVQEAALALTNLRPGLPARARVDGYHVLHPAARGHWPP